MPPSAHTAGGRGVTRWARDSIIEKIREWNEAYGEPPCSADWNPSLARWRAQEWRAERYRDGAWPSTNAAKRPFGGAVAAAGRAAALRAPSERVRAAERRAAALERALAAAESRAERAEGRLDDARTRARRAGER